jgi:polyisoprenoid-binding protein YceI
VREFDVNPDGSTVVIDARSSVGPIAWEAVGLSGWFSTATRSGGIDFGAEPSGQLDIPIAAFTSGNRVYDSELQRRVDARLYPTAQAELTGLEHVSDEEFRAHGRLTFHGITRPISGLVQIHLREDGSVVASGEQVVDIRDFGVPPPSLLMLKIYPDVRVHMVLHGRPVG